MFFKKQCYFCKKKVRPYFTYREKGKKVYCCPLCKTYADRRAFVPVK